MAARLTQLMRNGLSEPIKTLSSCHTTWTTKCTRFSQARRQVSSKLWSLGKLNHIAIAVPDLERASALYRDVFGASVSEAMPLPAHGVTTVFVDLGNTKIELLHPLGDSSPIQSFLDKKPEGGMHHMCIEVDDIKAAMESIQTTVRLLSQHPKIGAHGKPVVFLHPKDCDGVLIELEEK